MVRPTNRSYSQKTRLSGLLYGVKIWTERSSVFSQIMRSTDRQTNGQTDSFLVARSRCMQCMQRGKTEVPLHCRDCTVVIRV